MSRYIDNRERPSLNIAMPQALIDLGRDLSDLLDLVAGEEDLDDLLRRGVDWLARVVPYDLCVVFTLDRGRLVARLARGPLARPEVRRHALDLERFPTIREALQTRRARAYREEDHAHGDGDPFDGVLDLPDGHSCMVVPLCAGDRCMGVMTLDRAECVPYDEGTVTLVEVYGQILAVALRLAEQKLVLDRLRREERERERLLEARLVGDPAGLVTDTASERMREVLTQARRVAATDTPVLLLGETGTGKERLARAVHGWSARAEGPFVALNSAAIPGELMESELFGHAKGAFTGAGRARAGRFQMANGGTLLLDEVGELPSDLQAKLLRVLQDGTFEPVGSDDTIKADVRVLAATHVDLAQAVEAGRFRRDLYYRLSVFPLVIPPLRERLGDLPALCAALLEQQAQRTGRRGLTVSEDGLALLARYAWPGNVRELGNVLERAAILAAGPTLGPSELGRALGPAPGEGPRLGASLQGGELTTLDEAQRRAIRAALRATGGRIHGKGGAAELLAINPSTLQSRMKKLGVRRREG